MKHEHTYKFYRLKVNHTNYRMCKALSTRDIDEHSLKY